MTNLVQEIYWFSYQKDLPRLIHRNKWRNHRFPQSVLVMPQSICFNCWIWCYKKFVVSVLKLPIIYPAVQEAQNRMRHEAEDVLHQRPHVRVSCFCVGVDSWGQLTSFPSWEKWGKIQKKSTFTLIVHTSHFTLTKDTQVTEIKSICFLTVNTILDPEAAVTCHDSETRRSRLQPWLYTSLWVTPLSSCWGIFQKQKVAKKLLATQSKVHMTFHAFFPWGILRLTRHGAMEGTNVCEKQKFYESILARFLVWYARPNLSLIL